MHLAILMSFIVTAILALPLAYMRSMFNWEVQKGIALPLIPVRFYLTAALPCIAMLLMIAYQLLSGFYEHSALVRTVFGWLAIAMPLILLALFLWRPRAQQRVRLRGR